MMTDACIRFYRANERPFGVLSNLYRREVIMDGTRFRCVEDAYQSRKPRRQNVRAWLLAAPTPALVAVTAHALLHWDIAPGWSRFRYAWMLRCLQAKFRQHADLSELLVATGAAQIVEAANIDNEVNRRWGHVNGRGRNLLGRMLMRVRAELGGSTYDDGELQALIERGEALLEASCVE